jgi:SWI/SNF-like complex subunit BAF250/Osa
MFCSGSTKKEEDSISLKRKRQAGWWFDEDGLFNLDEEGRAEKQLCAIAASNIIRNFSFMPENETIMVQHRHCLETVFQCLEDQNTGTAILCISLQITLNIYDVCGFDQTID